MVKGRIAVSKKLHKLITTAKRKLKISNQGYLKPLSPTMTILVVVKYNIIHRKIYL